MLTMAPLGETWRGTSPAANKPPMSFPSLAAVERWRKKGTLVPFHIVSALRWRMHWNIWNNPHLKLLPYMPVLNYMLYSSFLPKLRPLVGCIKRFAGHFGDIRKNIMGGFPLSTSPVGSVSPSYCTTHLGEFHQKLYFTINSIAWKKDTFRNMFLTFPWNDRVLGRVHSELLNLQNGVDYAAAFAGFFEVPGRVPM